MHFISFHLQIYKYKYNFCYFTDSIVYKGWFKIEFKFEQFTSEFQCEKQNSDVRRLYHDANYRTERKIFIILMEWVCQKVSCVITLKFQVKQSMKENAGDKILQRVLHSRQLGLKLIANVTYGYTSANFSGRMPCIEVTWLIQ